MRNAILFHIWSCFFNCAQIRRYFKKSVSLLEPKTISKCWNWSSSLIFNNFRIDKIVGWRPIQFIVYGFLFVYFKRVKIVRYSVAFNIFYWNLLKKVMKIMFKSAERKYFLSKNLNYNLKRTTRFSSVKLWIKSCKIKLYHLGTFSFPASIIILYYCDWNIVLRQVTSQRWIHFYRKQDTFCYLFR